MIDMTKMKFNDWYVDSGAMQHMTNRRLVYGVYSAKNGITLQAMGPGHVVVQTFNEHTWNKHSFLDV